MVVDAGRWLSGSISSLDVSEEYLLLGVRQE